MLAHPSTELVARAPCQLRRAHARSVRAARARLRQQRRLEVDKTRKRGVQTGGPPGALESRPRWLFFSRRRLPLTVVNWGSMFKLNQVGSNPISGCRGRTQGARVTNSSKPFFFPSLFFSSSSSSSSFSSSFTRALLFFFLLLFFLLFFSGARTKGSPQGRGLGRSPRSQTVHHGEEEKHVKHDSK
jgi:hypothetical protein